MAYVLESRCGRVQFGGHLQLRDVRLLLLQNDVQGLVGLALLPPNVLFRIHFATEKRWRHAASIFTISIKIVNRGYHFSLAYMLLLSATCEVLLLALTGDTEGDQGKGSATDSGDDNFAEGDRSREADKGLRIRSN